MYVGMRDSCPGIIHLVKRNKEVSFVLMVMDDENKIKQLCIALAAAVRSRHSCSHWHHDGLFGHVTVPSLMSLLSAFNLLLLVGPQAPRFLASNEMHALYYLTPPASIAIDSI
jgi:hypothetical protein